MPSEVNSCHGFYELRYSVSRLAASVKLTFRRKPSAARTLEEVWQLERETRIVRLSEADERVLYGHVS